MNEKADKAFKLHNQIVKNEEERLKIVSEEAVTTVYGNDVNSETTK